MHENCWDSSINHALKNILDLNPIADNIFLI